MSDPRRSLPAVGTLLEREELRPLFERAPRAVVAEAVRAAVDAARRDPESAPRDATEWAALVSEELSRRTRRSLRPLFNATGVILHTNLGRAPLARAAVEAIRDVALGYSNLEYDLDEGARGSRYTHCVGLLRELTEAEDAIVVNNCAAALVLALNAIAEGREAIVSRGELIEIGGSFRVPEIMAKSGARLVEVGTTNRTHLDDYRRAVSERTGAIVKVHRSNFEQRGFVADVPLRDLVELGAELGVPVLHDFGGGLLVSLEEFGLGGEPTVPELVRAGASLVMMSGDKLLGGPQAGIVVGRAELVARLRKNPLTRAFRVDKLTLAALEATLAIYREPARALREIPTLAMLTAPVEEIFSRAAAALDVVSAVGRMVSLEETYSAVGGGAFPTARIPSAGIFVSGDAKALEATLRRADPSIIARIEADRVVLDLRSVAAADDEAFRAALHTALG